jgi:hypothetical protein
VAGYYEPDVGFVGSAQRGVNSSTRLVTSLEADELGIVIPEKPCDPLRRTSVPNRAIPLAPMPKYLDDCIDCRYEEKQQP